MSFKLRINIFRFLLLVALAVMVAPSCQKEPAPDPEPTETDPLASIKSYTYAIMNDIYYWYKEVIEQNGKNLK